MDLHYIYILFFSLPILYLLRVRYSRGLNKFNGPFLASFTDLWKVWYAYHNSDTVNNIYVDIHHQYGDVVRIGPNNLTFADPQAIHDIYGTKGSQQKSRFYDVTSPPVDGRERPTLLSSTDTRWHDQQRRQVNSAFSLTSILKYEGWVNDSISVFMRRMETHYVGKSGKEGMVDLSEWLVYFTADVISNLTYGTPTGFMENGTDVEGIINMVRLALMPWLYFTRMPILDRLTFKNPILLWLQRRGILKIELPLRPMVRKHVAARKQVLQSQKVQSMDRETLVDRFLRAETQNLDRGAINPEEFAIGMILAGSETTAIALTSVLYFVLRHPQCYQKLQQEVDSMPEDQLSSQGEAKVFSWTTAQKLPYLDACIQEASRLLPAQRMPHDRVVPPGGLVICGQYVPEGTDVGINASVIHRRVAVFGEDVETFRPERWLEDTASRKRMDDAMFTFSFGKFNCMGQNISRMEMYKFLPSVLRKFEFTLEHPNLQWKLLNGAFCIPTNVFVRISKRSLS